MDFWMGWREFWRAHFVEAFDSDDVRGVELPHQRDAGGNRAVVELGIAGTSGANEDGAGSAVAFGADDFGAGEVLVVAEIVGEHEEGMLAADFMAVAVDEEEGVVAHGRSPKKAALAESAATWQARSIEQARLSRKCGGTLGARAGIGGNAGGFVYSGASKPSEYTGFCGWDSNLNMSASALERAGLSGESRDNYGALRCAGGNDGRAGANHANVSFAGGAGSAGAGPAVDAGGGADVRTDAAGNLIGRRESAVAGAKTLVVGSHLDTVPNAGKYDGILGVMAGIALAELTRAGRAAGLPFALEVVGFSEEEGVRFGKPYIGSHAYAGTLDAAWLLLKDKDGVTVEEAIRQFGLDPDSLRKLQPREDIFGYLELHIEQGVFLEALNLPAGVVTGIAAQTRMMVDVRGEAAHAGTTAMGMRRDALAGAAEIVGAIEKIAVERGDGIVATVGRIDVWPNASNVVSGEARFSVDVRGPGTAKRDGAAAAIVEAAQRIATRRGLEIGFTGREDFSGVRMNPAMVAGLSAAAGQVLGQESAEFVLESGAGHDAAILGEIAPVGMIFLRNPGGISHNPRESVAAEDVAVGLRIAERYLLDLGEAMRQNNSAAIPSMERA